MKKVVLFVVILAVVCAFYWSHRRVSAPLTRVYIVPYETDFKPTIPSGTADDMTVVLNQSTFMFTDIPEKNHFIFPVTNKELTNQDLKYLATQMVPLQSQIHIL